MEERTYLKWYNKIGYGSGDIAGNVVYAFLSSFVMLYLTNSIGLNAGIVGSLIAVSKLFDGVTDVFFGAMIDKTHSKMGKARPWMFYGYFGCALTLIGIFAIPVNLGETAQYAWFFITYTLLTSFMGPWVDYIFAKVIMGNDTKYYTIAIGLWTMLEKEYVDYYYTQFYAGCVLISIPIAIVFLLSQRCYVEGVAGAVKG